LSAEAARGKSRLHLDPHHGVRPASETGDDDKRPVENHQ